MSNIQSIFLAVAPGLEPIAAAEAAEIGLAGEVVPGGVALEGSWPEVVRVNMLLRVPSRVLVRVAEFRAMHPAQLDKRSRKVDWTGILPRNAVVRVEATCRASRIYHRGAAAKRVLGAIVDATGGRAAREGEVAFKVLVRIDDDLCTLSLDTSGDPLHRRGYKEAVGKAPMRDNLAAGFLRACGYTGDEPVLDPMCGSGTFLLEAAQMALGIPPGAKRRFAFERLPGCEAVERAFEPGQSDLTFYGSDRDQGAVKSAAENARRAGVAAVTQFAMAPMSAIERPDGSAGLVMVNPPYGARIGNKKQLYGLYGSLGKVLSERFHGWRVGLVTSEPALAKSTGLPFADNPLVVPLGSLKVALYQTAPLAS